MFIICNPDYDEYTSCHKEEEILKELDEKEWDFNEVTIYEATEIVFERKLVRKQTLVRKDK